MRLTGILASVRRVFESDDRWVAKLFAEMRAKDAAALAEAKREAPRRGKERFDLDRFDQLQHPPKNGTREQQIATYEREYYVVYPDVMTLQEFADLLMRLDVDKDK